MEYLSSILWLIAWPILIYAAYRFAKFNVGFIEKKEAKELASKSEKE